MMQCYLAMIKTDFVKETKAIVIMLMMINDKKGIKKFLTKENFNLQVMLYSGNVNINQQ